jgi:hypothetical protein
MSNLLPIIEQLADARDDSQRVEWLLQCPFGILSRYQMTIRNRLMHAGFIEGIAYLETISVMMASVRSVSSGDFRPETKALLAASIENMQAAVRQLAGAPAAEPTDF